MPNLKPSELEIMRILWKYGPLKPAEIQERLTRPVKNSALRFELGCLVEKGHAIREKHGKAFFYSAKIRPHSALRKVTRKLAEIFSEGSSVALIGQMIESENLSDDDIRELQRLATKAKRKTPQRKRGRK